MFGKISNVEVTCFPGDELPNCLIIDGSWASYYSKLFRIFGDTQYNENGARSVTLYLVILYVQLLVTQLN